MCSTSPRLYDRPMGTVHWNHEQATSPANAARIDELDDVDLLLLDGVTAADDNRLTWCRRAPCVVAGLVAAGSRAPESVDLVLGGDDDLVDTLSERVASNPAASRVLVDVLRIMPDLKIAAGLVVESLAYSMLLTGPEFGHWLAQQPKRSAARTSGPPVMAERDADTLTLMLNRPRRHNAFSAEIRDALLEGLSIAESDPSIERIEVSGAGPTFSSGGDLAEFGQATDVVRAHRIRTLRSVGAAIDRLAERVTVYVQGRCVGAGIELPAFAGRVVAAEDLTLRLPEIGMGLIPGAGGTVSLTRRLGRHATALMALSGREISVTDPLARGYADEVVTS